MSWGIIIISIILSFIYQGKGIAKLFMFLTFISIMCSLFGAYIPFSMLIVDIANFISVMTMIGLGAIFIFLSGGSKKDNKIN